MVNLNDGQLATLKEFAAPIPFHLRDRWLQALAHELRNCSDTQVTGSFFGQ